MSKHLLSSSLVFISLVVISLVWGCSRSAAPKAIASNPPQTEQPAAIDSQPSDARALQKQIEQIAANAKGRVGVAAAILETGEATGSIVSLDSNGHYPMQSVYKLPISMAVMKQVDAGKLKLDQKVRIEKEDYVGRAAHSPIRDQYPRGTELTLSELLKFALSESDGTASDVLMKLAGGPPAVQAYLTDLGINDMIVLDTEKAFAEDHSLQFRNYATPLAAVGLLRALHERRGLSESSQALLLKFMIESTPGPRRLKGLLPGGTIVAHKTGTSGTEKGITAATNDIGIVTLPTGRHLAIAVFVAESPADAPTREGVIAKITKAVFDSLNGK
jgi:beta-lactamase class A